MTPTPRSVRSDMPCASERFRTLEALLFVSPTPVRLSELAEATGWPEGLIERDLQQTESHYLEHGLELQRIAGAYRLASKSEYGPAIEKLIGVQTRRRLTRSQLETLAVVAYRQPVTRAQVEAYRGVNCDRLLGQLTDLRLVREAGRAELPGRPYLYATTSEFLRYFGLDKLDSLPDLGELKRQSPSEAGISASQAHWNASARGEAHWDQEAASLPSQEAAATPSASKSLRKLLDKIRGRSPVTQRIEEAS